MASEWSISEPTSDDLASACQLLAETITDAFRREGIGHLQDELCQEIAHKTDLLRMAVDGVESDFYFLVIKAGHDVIGTISYGPPNDLIGALSGNKLKLVGEMGNIYVLPSHQGRGVASSLIDAMLEHLYEAGVERFCLDSGYKLAQAMWLRRFGEPSILARDHWGENSHHMIWYRDVASERLANPRYH